MSNNPLRGAAYFFRGLPLITAPGIRRYVVIPLCINVAGLGALIYFGYEKLGALRQWLSGWLPGWLDWLSWLLLPLFWIAAVLVFVFGFALLANLVAAPFNGFLAEAVERRVTGQSAGSATWSGVAGEIVRTLSAEWHKQVYFLVRAVPLLALFLIPGVNLFAPLLWAVFSAWMLALEYTDFPLGNHGVAFGEQRRLARERWLLGLGFGAMVMLALTLPLLQFVVVPAAVAGATLMWVEELQPRKRASR